MKKLVLLMSILMIAFIGFAAVASAQEASVFGNGVLVRAFIECSSGCGDGETPLYSAYLEVRDASGAILPVTDFAVDGVLGTSDPVVAENPFKIHDNDLLNNDVSLTYGNVTKTLYAFCTDTEEGLHVMKYDIKLTTRANGVCVTYNQGLTQEPTDLCMAGDPSVVAGSGPWSWTCYGLYGGTDADCSANLLVNGACGPSNGGTFATMPVTNLCNSGTASGVSGSGPWNWTCAGLYGGTPASCSANIQVTGNNIDLAITSFSAPTATSYGAAWNTKVIVKNNSSNQAGAFNLKFYSGTTLLRTVSLSGGLAGGASTTVYTSLYLNLPAHVWKVITVVAEPNASDTDTNTANNSAMRSVSGV